jgi:hypothetical protein
MTFTVRVHEVPAARAAPDKLTVPLPATAVAVPPEVLVSPFGEATNRFWGKLLVKATPVNATVLIAGLARV